MIISNTIVINQRAIIKIAKRFLSFIPLKYNERTRIGSLPILTTLRLQCTQLFFLSYPLLFFFKSSTYTAIGNTNTPAVNNKNVAVKYVNNPLINARANKP